jgi:hypothetical protein
MLAMFLNMHTCDVCGDEDVRHALLEVRDDPVAVVLVELAVDARDCTRTRAPNYKDVLRKREHLDTTATFCARILQKNYFLNSREQC